MPGRGSYGPGGKWIHDRANRIMSEGKTEAKYGPERGKQIAYAIATQQAHKLGKTPKKKGGYGTSSGRAEAKAKYDQPAKAYKKTASTKDTRLGHRAGVGALAGGTAGLALPLLAMLKDRRGGTPNWAGTIPIGALAGLLSGVAYHKVKEKSASMAGQDLRKPFMGGTKFPTMDSKSIPMQNLRASQRAAEVGPVPTPKQLRPKGPSIKYGADMSNDPLIQYLRKTAAVLDDNLEDMPTGADEGNLTSECPMPSGEARTAPAADKKLLGKLFSHPSKEAKYLARMHPVSSGGVDRVLKRH